MFDKDETLIIQHVADGLTDTEIAKAMDTTPAAIGSILVKLYKRTASRNRAHLVHTAHQMGVIN